MELNPEFNVELTSKREVPQEHSIEDLMKEWEDKENVVEPEKVTTKLPKGNYQVPDLNTNLRLLLISISH